MTGCSVFISSFHREATNQKLKIAEAAVRNQDKNAIMTDNWYLPQNLGEHWDPWNWRRRSITAALEQAAANESTDSTCKISSQEMPLHCHRVSCEEKEVYEMCVRT